MPPIKYKQLTEEMLRRIAAGEYAPDALLPPCRKLAAEFGVSSRTLYKAFCELKLAGAIRPTPRGTRIGAATADAPRTGVKTVFIFIYGGEANGRGQVLYEHLCGRIRAGGWQSRVVDNFAPEFPGFDRFEFAPGDGAIFLFSSFRPEFREPLVRRGIPFVVANRPPAATAVNWVDWNHLELFDNVIGRLVKRGFRDIHILYPHGESEPPPVNLEMMLADFLVAKKAWSLPTDRNPDVAIFYKLDVCMNYLQKRPQLPDGILVFASIKHYRELVARLQKLGVPDPEKFLLPFLGEAEQNSGCVGFYSGAGCRHMADKVWTLFKRVAINPAAPVCGMKQRCTVKYNDIFLRNLRISTNHSIKKG